MAKFDSFRQNFNNNTAPTNWGSFNGGGSYTNQRVEINSQLAATYLGVNTGSLSYDLTGSFLFTEFIGFDSGATSISSYEVYPINMANAAGTDGYLWQVLPSSNVIAAYKKVASVNTYLGSETYVAKRHRWFRIREASGTTYFDTSADGRVWTNKYSVANLASITTLYVGYMVGTWQAEGTQAKSYFDNMNVPSFIPLISS